MGPETRKALSAGMSTITHAPGSFERQSRTDRVEIEEIMLP
ncbi:hypothetical protein W91_0396 [Bifidobacterium animalis subsp. lactis Bi-07]|nr:hypothetical protein W91_0396 [Bifidobacterium animalis subsp. lactis Bi-07]